MSLKRKAKSLGRSLTLASFLTLTQGCGWVGCESEAEVQTHKIDSLEQYLWEKASYEMDRDRCLIVETASRVKADTAAVVHPADIVEYCEKKVGSDPAGGNVKCIVELDD